MDIAIFGWDMSGPYRQRAHAKRGAGNAGDRVGLASAARGVSRGAIHMKNSAEAIAPAVREVQRLAASYVWARSGGARFNTCAMATHARQQPCASRRPRVSVSVMKGRHRLGDRGRQKARSCGLLRVPAEPRGWPRRSSTSVTPVLAWRPAKPHRTDSANTTSSAPAERGPRRSTQAPDSGADATRAMMNQRCRLFVVNQTSRYKNLCSETKVRPMGDMFRVKAE